MSTPRPFASAMPAARHGLSHHARTCARSPLFVAIAAAATILASTPRANASHATQAAPNAATDSSAGKQDAPKTIGDSPEWPESWFWRLGASGPAHVAMTGQPAPALTVRDWRGGDPELAKLLASSSNPIEALRGKIVVVDFWATWCGPCRKALPENVELAKDLAAKGVVVLGIHDAARGSEKMDDIARGASVNYPMSIDDGGKSAAAWKVGFWPTYGVVDQQGTLRAIGLQPQYVRKVVERLVREGATGPTPKGDASAGKPTGTPDDGAAGDASNGKSDGAKPADASRGKPASEPKAGTRSGGLVPAGTSNGRDAKAPGANPKDAASKPAAPLPASALEGNPARRAALAKFDGAPAAPALSVSNWMNAEDLPKESVSKESVSKENVSKENVSEENLPKDAAPDAQGAPTLASLKGKIVVLDFWATWCGPCLASVPKMNAFAQKYRDKGVVLIGVCHKDKGDKMAEVAKARGIAYPICLDEQGLTNSAYLVDSYPDYYIIDREGRLRGADIGNGSLEAAVDRLLAE